VRGRLILLLFALGLIGCPSGTRDSMIGKPQLSRDLPDLRTDGVLRALVDNNSVSYFIYKGRSMGFEYELLQDLAAFLKLELKIRVISGVEEAINQLNKGEGDLIAFPLTITRERKNYLQFTRPLFQTSQVLVQRKPANWRANPDLAEREMIRTPAELIGREVHVLAGSSFAMRLRNLSEEIGGEIMIREDSAGAETEALIRRVSEGTIDYTVTDQTLALVNAAYYSNLDVKTLVSLPQQIGWATRTNSPRLTEAINQWLSNRKKSGYVKIVYDKYFNSPRTVVIRGTSDYSSISGAKLSPWDDEIKKGASELGWDWRLLGAVIYTESNFKTDATSWAGAQGLMQLMPETAEQFGAADPTNPIQSIRAGVKFLKFLDTQWGKTITDPQERLKFVLASYNVGITHVIDARNLTKKYGKNPVLWEDNVAYYLLQKSRPEFYRDPVAAGGYCRCEGPVSYVKEVTNRYEEYKTHLPEATPAD
jgi:membrane-bound lytic murein transglycosylase F